MQAQRRMWKGVNDEGEDTYDLVTIYYHYDSETQMNIADSVEYTSFQHVDQKDDPAIVDSLDDILDELEVHSCELNQMTNNFEIVSCWNGCRICK